jgi:hypothetical protein
VKGIQIHLSAWGLSAGEEYELEKRKAAKNEAEHDTLAKMKLERKRRIIKWQ